MKTKLRKIGSGYGVVLPKRVIDHLRLSAGDELELTESKAGVELSPFDPDFAEQVEASGGAAVGDLSSPVRFCVLHCVSGAELMAYSVCGCSPRHPSRAGSDGSRWIEGADPLAT